METEVYKFRNKGGQHTTTDGRTIMPGEVFEDFLELDRIFDNKFVRIGASGNEIKQIQIEDWTEITSEFDDVPDGWQVWKDRRVYHITDSENMRVNGKAIRTKDRVREILQRYAEVPMEDED